MISYLIAKLGARKKRLGFCPPDIKTDRYILAEPIDAKEYSMFDQSVDSKII
jgi:hypothetical protein